MLWYAAQITTSGLQLLSGESLYSMTSSHAGQALFLNLRQLQRAISVLELPVRWTEALLYLNCSLISPSAQTYFTSFFSDVLSAFPNKFLHS